MGSLPRIVEDCLGIVQVYSDGSVSRSADINFQMKVQDDGSAVWKDCLFDKKHNLHLRLYKPRSPSTTKLPIVFFFHGGGFCICSRTWPNCHSCCLRLSSGLQALVVAPDYRLAPEHRLPAALDDAVSSVEWLRNQALLLYSGGGDEWFANGGVNFDRVFIMGDSSGGNLAHHVAVKLRCGSPELAPVRVRGYVLMAPFFGGTVRTKSEEGPPETFLNLELLDRFWRLSVPEGSNSDHPWANPFGPASPRLDCIKLDPILVLVGGREVMKDRIDDYTKKLKEMGKEVDYVEYPGMQHGFFINEPFSEMGNKVLEEIDSFMLRNYH